jgi:hypothetical protein
MKIQKIITSVNIANDYLTFAPTLCKIWRELHGLDPIVAFIKSDNEDLNYICQEYLLKSSCNLITFDKINIDYGIQSKISRMFLAAEFTDSNNMIVDIDMLPMTSKFLESYHISPEDHLVKFGSDHFSFQKHPDIGKWPMHGTAARGSTFREIINPDGLAYEELIRSWVGFPQDPRSNVFNPFHGFSDDSLLKCLHDRWSGKDDRCTTILRTGVDGDYNSEPVYGRLCRSRHHDISNTDLTKYYECHGPRPFHRNLEWYNQLFNFMGFEKTPTLSSSEKQSIEQSIPFGSSTG